VRTLKYKMDFTKGKSESDHMIISVVVKKFSKRKHYKHFVIYQV